MGAKDLNWNKEARQRREGDRGTNETIPQKGSDLTELRRIFKEIEGESGMNIFPEGCLFRSKEYNFVCFRRTFKKLYTASEMNKLA